LDKIALIRLRDDLVSIVGSDSVSDNDADKFVYSGGASTAMPPVRKVGRWGSGTSPLFIVWPQTTEHVVKLVKLARQRHFPLVPWGGAVGYRGGSLPVHQSAVIVDTKKMNRIIDIDERAMTVTVQCGTFVEDINLALDKIGYWFPMDPPSFCASTIGGFVGASAAGWFVPKYGYIGDLLICMEIVLPTGEVLRTKPVMKHSVGPDLNWLFVGAGGTLGITTEITLKCYPKPAACKVHVATFDSFHDAFETAYEITKRGAHPFVLRVGDDGHSLNYLGPELDYRELEGCTIVAGFDGDPSIVDAEEHLALEEIQRHGGTDLGLEMGEVFMATRFNYFRSRKDPNYFTDVITTCTSFSKLESIYWDLRRLYERLGVYWSHHIPHFNAKGASLYNIYRVPTTEEGIELCERIRREGLDIVLGYGATIEHHHEIGIHLAQYVRAELGVGLDVLQAIKDGLDPDNIMNPGKICLRR